MEGSAVHGISAVPTFDGEGSVPGNTPSAPLGKGRPDGHRHPVAHIHTDLLPDAVEMNSSRKHGIREI